MTSRAGSAKEKLVGKTAIGAFAVALLLVAASTLLLPVAEKSFLFGGHGFGTVLAQGIFWISFRIVAWVTGDVVNTSLGAILAVEGSLNVLVFLLVVGAAWGISKLTHRGFSRVLAGVTFCYLLLLFVWPQATYGP